jgi:adenylate kinase
MKVLIAGLPGSGKSTQTQKLASELGYPPIHMGESLRKIASEGGELGEKVKEIMHKGHLVDDQTVAEVIQQVIKENGADKGFVMEGYPRSIAQIEIFDPGFDKVLYLALPEEELIKRLTERGRSDDTPDAVKTRIEVQKAGLDKVLEHYKEQLIEVEATGTIDEVFEKIKSHLK